MQRMVLLAAGLGLAVGCSRPPDAPTDLETLTGFLFEHMKDEEPDAMVAGVANLDAWLSANLAPTSEGYAIANISQESLDALDDTERNSAGLDGAAVSTSTEFTVQQVAEALIEADQMTVYPDRFETYDRTFSEDISCFLDHQCETMDYHSDLDTNLPLGIQVNTKVNGTFRWVDLEGTPVLVGRTWLAEPAEVSVDFFKVQAQYYLTVNLPTDVAGTTRLHAMWAETQLLSADIPESTALNMLISSLSNGDEMLYEYLEAQP